MTFKEFITAIKKFDSRYGDQCSWSYGDSGKFSATATGAGIISQEIKRVDIEWDKHFTVTVSGSASVGRGDTIEDAFLDWEYAESKLK